MLIAEPISSSSVTLLKGQVSVGNGICPLSGSGSSNFYHNELSEVWSTSHTVASGDLHPHAGLFCRESGTVTERSHEDSPQAFKTDETQESESVKKYDLLTSPLAEKCLDLSRCVKINNSRKDTICGVCQSPVSSDVSQDNEGIHSEQVTFYGNLSTDAIGAGEAEKVPLSGNNGSFWLILS